ncbi:glycosyltransferase [bacterium]|nr:glycosyltransferase [bacterium]
MIIGIDASRATSDTVTGTERYSREIIRHLLALPAATAHCWRLYTRKAVDLSLFGAGNLPHVEIRPLSTRRLWTHRALAWEVVRHRPDVLFVPAHVIPLLPPPLLPRSVVTIHDVGYRHFPEAHTRPQRIYLDGSTRWSVSAARRVVAISQFTANDLTRFYGIKAGKVEVVYEGVPESQKSTRQPTAAVGAQKAKGADRVEAVSAVVGNRPYALYVGTIQPRKNLARLIEAYSRICGRVDWDLVLVGKRGWLSEDLYTAAVQHGVGERVHFPGYLPDDVVDELMAGARFFAFPSLFEGFGLPVLEAQQKGTPVMTSYNSSLPEIAGDAAILVDPMDIDAIADAMLRLSEDEALRQQLIAAGLKNVKRFSWEKAAQETLAVLEKAAKGNE